MDPTEIWCKDMNYDRVKGRGVVNATIKLQAP